MAIFTALDNSYKFTIAAVGIDVDDEFSHASQIKVMKEIKTQINKQDVEMPYIIVTQTNEEFLSKDETLEEGLAQIIKTNVNFS